MLLSMKYIKKKKKESNRVDQKMFLSDEYTLDWSHFLLDENTVVSWSGR